LGIVAVHMATNDQVNQISDGAILSSCKTAQVNERAVAEADLHAVRTLGVVGHQISTPEVVAGGKAHAVVTSEGEADTGMRGGDGASPTGPEASGVREPEASAVIVAGRVGIELPTAENPCEQGPEPLSYWIGLALLGLGDNSMEPPLRDPLFRNPRLSGHGNPPDGAGWGLHLNQLPSDKTDPHD
jgi:hypothetical protein